MRHRFTSKCGKYIYHMAIIDYLCKYDIDKKGENWFKSSCRKTKHAELISAVPPENYAKRFKHFMNREVIINEKKNTLSTGIKKKEFE